jgi:hypothetical protein
MGMTRWFVLATLSAAMLAGCHKPAPAKHAALTPIPGAGELHRKAGLWEQRVSNGDTTQVSRLCLDEATDSKLSYFGRQMNESSCEKHTVTAIPGGGWQFTTVCDMGSGGKVTTEGMATGDFSARYQVKAQTTTLGAELEHMNGVQRFVVDASWQGPCPPDMQAGDMVLPGGARVKVMDLASAPGR